MKKLIVGISLLAVSAVSMAAETQICTGAAGNNVNAAPSADDGTLFVKTAFIAKCSANTLVYFDQTANVAATGAVSTKGNQIFGGHTNGGAVVKVGDCASSGCVTGDASTALTNALTAGSS